VTRVPRRLGLIYSDAIFQFFKSCVVFVLAAASLSSVAYTPWLGFIIRTLFLIKFHVSAVASVSELRGGCPDG